MNNKKIYMVLGCLVVFILVLFMDSEKKNSWHSFFLAPTPEDGKLLQKAKPLERTQEINKKIQGEYSTKEESVHFCLEDMIKHIEKDHQEPASKVDPLSIEKEVISNPIQVEKQIIVKPIQVVKKEAPLSSTEKDYFPVSFERKGRKKNTKVKNKFISGYVYGRQELKHGRSIKIRVQESFSFQGHLIPKGALLYGVVAFGKERVLAKLETAEFGKNALPVTIALYDSDYILGLLVENLHPFLDNAQDRLLSRAASSSSNSWVREISETAVDAIKSMKKEPKVTLENRRRVLLKPIEKS